MFEYFKITALNKADFAQLVWLVGSKKFFPEFSSTPPLPRQPSGSFDYREFFIVDAVDDRERTVTVRTRQKYSVIEFGVNVVPTAEWVSRYGLSGAPNISGISIVANRNSNFRALQSNGGKREFQVYEYPVGDYYTIHQALQSWYDALTVKPGFVLLEALNTLVGGLVDDGNWDLLDLLSLTGGMDTDEQRKRPIKTTSGNVLTTVLYDPDNFPNASPIYNGLGVRSDGNSCIDLGWSPRLHGVNYTLLNAMHGVYITQKMAQSSRYLMGSEYDTDNFNTYSVSVISSGSSTNDSIRGDINGTSASGILRNAIPPSFKRLKAIVREGVGGVTRTTFNVNATTSVTSFQSTPATVMPKGTFYGLDTHYVGESVGFENDIPSQSGVTNGTGYIGAFIAGSASVDLLKLQARLDQFFLDTGTISG